MKTISDQIFVSLALPMDSKNTNIVLSGSNIKIEEVEQYLERVDINSRYLGLKVIIYSPPGNYNINSFIEKISNAEITQKEYWFKERIIDEYLVEYIEETDPVYLSEKDTLMNINGSNSSIDVLNFNGNYNGTSFILTMTWNEVRGTFDLQLPDDVTGQMFQELHFHGKAIENISNGDVVMFAGAEGGHSKVAKADKSVLNIVPRFIMGVATHDILQGAFGKITWFGEVNNVNTSYYYSDDPNKQILYFDSSGSTPGRFTINEPHPPNAKIVVAAVVKHSTGAASNGTILVRPDFAYRVDQLNDTNIVNIQPGQFLVRSTDNLKWENKTLEDLYLQGSLSIPRGEYRYDSISHLQDTAGDWRTYSDANGYYVQYCTVSNATKGGGTWVTKQTIPI